MQESNKVKHITQGGQIVLHQLRMIAQVMKKVTLVSIVVFLLMNVLLFYTQIPAYQRYVASQYWQASLYHWFDDNIAMNFTEMSGAIDTVSVKQLITSPKINQLQRQVTATLISNALLSLFAYGVIFSLLLLWLRRRGREHTQDKHMNGDRLLPVKDVKKIIVKRGVNSDLHWGELPLIKDSECSHFLLHGTTGSGKSSYIKALLDQIR